MRQFLGALTALTVLTLLAACSPSTSATSGKKTIMVTISPLANLVGDLVGDDFDVQTLIPDGQDPHEWAPSAKDIERVQKAALIVRNGLGLEGGLIQVLDQAAASGVPQFVVSDHLTVRHVKAGEGLPTGDPDQAEGAEDPHLWLDPAQLAGVMTALAVDLNSRFGVNLTASATALGERLTALAQEVKTMVDALPADRRLLVTGHESLGYFAEANGLTLVGAIVPSLTDQAEVSAADLASLKAEIQNRHVSVLFTELGTPPKVVDALAQEVHLKAVEITTHALGGQDYFGFIRNLATTIVTALAGETSAS